jgi:rhomboid family GlyGly-CTERM serine protease
MKALAPPLQFLMDAFHCRGASGLWLVTGCAVLILPELAGDAGRAILRYDRAGLHAGQLWRLLSAHIVHLDLRHTVLNALGFVLMWGLFAQDYRPLQWIMILLAGIAGIDLGLWLLDPELNWYVGSSGALHALMAAGTLAHLRRREGDGWILLAFLVTKLTYEQWSGSLPLAGEDVAVVVDAHLYGALAGFAAAIWLKPAPKLLHGSRISESA